MTEGSATVNGSRRYAVVRRGETSNITDFRSRLINGAMLVAPGLEFASNPTPVVPAVQVESLKPVVNQVVSIDVAAVGTFAFTEPLSSIRKSVPVLPPPCPYETSAVCAENGL